MQFLGLSFISLAILLLIGVDLLLALTTLKKRSPMGTAFFVMSIFAALTSIAFGGRILASTPEFYAIISSVYYVLLIGFFFSSFTFIRSYGLCPYDWLSSRIWKFILCLTCLSAIFMLVLPYGDFVADFSVKSSAQQVLQGSWFFGVYQATAYVMIACCIVCLMVKVADAPREYRLQYMYPCIVMCLAVITYCIFTFSPALKKYDYASIDVALYSVCVILLYWSCFYYSTHGMLNHFKSTIFESVDQAIILFDRTDHIILSNKLAKDFLPEGCAETLSPLPDFLVACGIQSLDDVRNDSVSFQCVVKKNGEEKPLRCDYRILKNRNKVIGKLFIFTNTILETDLLTGFHNLEAFEVFVRDSNTCDEQERVAISICDINGLSLINASKGRLAGDTLLRSLADKLREIFPKSSYFIRGRNAELITVSYSLSEDETKALIEKVKSSVDADVVSAVAVTLRTPDHILQGMESADRAMHQKKLLDQKSLHSSALTSLVRALQECDDDTESHVKRTQKMGAELGKRLGLTDVQLSDLSLLCLLHDIGKIAVPLEILNKPGKLNSEEWIVMKSHVEKGYQIAKSSKELEGIADMVRHHHERWDGKGYPDGLSCETIPLLSRVIAVVDSYDAMVSDRVYRKGMEIPAALDELVHCAGTQFDPVIVSEFIQMLKDDPKLGIGKKDLTNRPVPVTERNYGLSSSTDDGSQKVHVVNFMDYVMDDDTFEILSVNKTFEDVSGYTQQEVLERKMTQMDLIPEEDRMEYMCKVSECQAQAQVAYFEHRFLRKDGRILYVLCMGRRFFDPVKKSKRTQVIVTDFSSTYAAQRMIDSQQHKADEQLRNWENIFRRDSLTGLLNRAAFQSEVEKKLLDGSVKVMLLMLDVDKFKEYNDTYGHHAGDEFLVLVGKILENSLRSMDISGRMGGDEFSAALFFKKDSSNELMYQRAQQIFDKINMSLKSATESTTLSMGAVIADEEKNTFNKIYEASDRALYRSKENGRGCLSTNG